MSTHPLETLELSIDRLGGLGDGIGSHAGKAVFVPFTCPGDTVKAAIVKDTKDGIRADLLKLLTPSPERQQPACAHFGTCGGCSLQHLNEARYNDFKKDICKVAKLRVANAEHLGELVSVGWALRRHIDKRTVGKDDIGRNAPRFR